MQQADIHFSTHGRAGLIELDRPKALNAISYEMAMAISTQIEHWSADAEITHIVIAGSTPRAFCAGGDVRDLYQHITRGEFDRTRVYFRAEYNADLDVFNCPKPVVALADGIVMGGGAGLMQCSHYRIASSTTRFAMPESAIGLFPDAGASIFLGRCPRPMALFIGLAGQIISAADCMMLGLADAVVPAEQIADMRTDLLACDVTAIDDVIARYRTDPGAAPLQAHRTVIDHVFSGDDLAAMRDRAGELAQLKGDEFAAMLSAALSTRCPMTMHVFLRLIDVGVDIPDMAAALAMDYRLAIRMSERADFSDGVRAVLVDKTNDATWSPARLEDVTPAMLDAVFDHAGLPVLR